VRTWIGAPYWLDESWVALSTRVPLSDLPTITSTTPIGWTLLLRAVPDPDALRVVPLAFALLAVVAAYAFGRALPWRGRVEAAVGGGLVASAVVLLPAAQQRHDLKQYTADAALALALLAVADRVDKAHRPGAGGRGWLGALTVAGPVAFLFSPASALVAAAVFGGLVLAAALRREWRAFAERLGAGVLSGAGLGGLYLLLVKPVQVPALAEFWKESYPAPGELVDHVRDEWRELTPYLGLHPWVWVVAVAAGVVALMTLRRPAAVGAMLLLPVVAVVLGLLKAYPLLDARTSYFLVVVAAALIGVGVARLITAVVTAIGTATARRALRRPVLEPTLAVLLALAATGAFAVANRSWYRYEGPTPISVSDVRTQTRWVQANRRPGDVVVISLNARYGYVFYQDDEPLRWTATPALSHGWDAVLSADPDVIAVGRSLADIGTAVEAAVARARANGPGARVFLIRSWWWLYTEPRAWERALAPYTVTEAYEGPEPVAIIEVPAP
jgi:hypothetical protein